MNTAEEPSIDSNDSRRIYVSSIISVAVLFLVGVSLPVGYAFGSWTWGIGLGVMCSLWGGPSFGVMVAAARMSLLEDRLGLHH